MFVFFFQSQFLGLKFRLSLVELEVKLTRKDFQLLFKLDSSPQKRRKRVLIMSGGSEECAVEIHGVNKGRRQCYLGAVSFISGDDCAAECSDCITRRVWVHLHEMDGGEEGR